MLGNVHVIIGVFCFFLSGVRKIESSELRLRKEVNRILHGIDQTDSYDLGIRSWVRQELWRRWSQIVEVIPSFTFPRWRINNILRFLNATNDDLFIFQKSNTPTYSNSQFEIILDLRIHRAAILRRSNVDYGIVEFRPSLSGLRRSYG